jgi:hypothetical protein
LALKIDEATDELNIIEICMEFLFGAGRSFRTCYRTKLVFPKGADRPSLKKGNFKHKHTQAALKNACLALTQKPADNPYCIPPLTRFPQNVHLGDNGYYRFTKTYLRYYNLSAGAFLDLADERLSTYPTAQRLRLRVSSRKLDPPARNCHGILVRKVSDPVTGEILYGLNDRYTACPVSFWPPDQDLRRPKVEHREELHKLMNPPCHRGEIEAFGDDRSIVYSTGGEEQPRAIVFISFDPATRLKGSRSWNDHVNRDNGKGKQRDGSSETFSSTNSDGKSWIWTEPAMYQAIDRNYSFGLTRHA